MSEFPEWNRLSICISIISLFPYLNLSCCDCSCQSCIPCALHHVFKPLSCSWNHAIIPAVQFFAIGITLLVLSVFFLPFSVSIAVLPFTRWISIPVCNKRHHRQYRFMTFSCSHQVPYVCPHWSLPNLTWTNSVSLLNTLLAYQPDRLFTGSFSLIAIQVLNLRPLILTPKQTLHPSHLIIIPSQQTVVFLSLLHLGHFDSCLFILMLFLFIASHFVQLCITK